MKRFILSIWALLPLLTINSQIYVWNHNSIAYGNDNTIDSICFGPSVSLWDNNTTAYTCPTDGIDSITFARGSMTASLLDFEIDFDESEKATYGNTTETVPTDNTAADYSDFIENRSFDQTVTIAFDGNSATINNPFDDVAIDSTNGDVTVNSTRENVEYVLTGNTSDGSFKIYSSADFKISLNNISLINPTGAAINIQSEKTAFIESIDGTSNFLIDGESYEIPDTEKTKSCIYSLGKLILGGGGSLSIQANYKHGISTESSMFVRSGSQTFIESVNDGIHIDGDFRIGGGCLEITSAGDGIQSDNGNIHIENGFIKIETDGEKSNGIKTDFDIYIENGCIQSRVYGLASKGLSADGDVVMSNGSVTLISSASTLYEDNDLSSSAGIKCDGNFYMNGGKLAAYSTGDGGKGINCDGYITINSGLIRVITTGKQYVYNTLDTSPKAIKGEKTLTINGGTILVKATGGEGSEGIESKDSIIVNNGTIVSYCYDDALNATNNITINGGFLYGLSTGNDAIDSNGTMDINGGIIVASGSGNPEGGIDCDQSTFTITGGILVGTGGSTSTPTERVCTQNSIVYNGLSGNISYINIQKSDGQNLLTFRIPQTYNSMTLLFSSPDLQLNTTYQIYTGGSVTGGNDIFGIIDNGTYSGGSSTTSFTTSSVVTTVGNSSPGGGGPGGGGGRP